MAALITAVTVTVLVGAVVGAFLKISFAIRRDDRMRGSLQVGPHTRSSQVARDLTGISSSRWD